MTAPPPRPSWGQRRCRGVHGRGPGQAAADRTPLYRWLAPHDSALRMPVPHFNVVNGGPHAQTPRLPRVHARPPSAPPPSPKRSRWRECYQSLRGLLHRRGLSTGLGGEGGFAPNLATPEEVLDLLVEAIAAAGYQPGVDGVAIALDPAASELRLPDGRYRYAADEPLTTVEMIDRYQHLVERYPIWSIEDALAEDDWAGSEQLISVYRLWPLLWPAGSPTAPCSTPAWPPPPRQVNLTAAP